MWARDSGFTPLEERGACTIMGNSTRKWDEGEPVRRPVARDVWSLPGVEVH